MGQLMQPVGITPVEEGWPHTPPITLSTKYTPELIFITINVIFYLLIIKLLIYQNNTSVTLDSNNSLTPKVWRKISDVCYPFVKNDSFPMHTCLA